jgi:hypothetical protein
MEQETKREMTLVMPKVFSDALMTRCWHPVCCSSTPVSRAVTRTRGKHAVEMRLRPRGRPTRAPTPAYQQEQPRKGLAQTQFWRRCVAKPTSDSRIGHRPSTTMPTRLWTTTPPASLAHHQQMMPYHQSTDATLAQMTNAMQLTTLRQRQQVRLPWKFDSIPQGSAKVDGNATLGWRARA